MSTTIDQKVVEMRFDNKQFENNVATSMSTLDKLKEKLNFSGAAKGLDNVSAAAGRVNMSGLGSAVEAVSAKFSALGVMGVTALANITNSAVNAGKKIISALTIEPIKMGFQEYETQINSVQTILANTSHAGTDLQDVNRVLDELNLYADKTIYNFTQMTKNIGTFTAAGVDLETSAAAIQGIANLAAVSGSTSQQASTAMYQLSQAIANGKVNLQDWNSVVNAGMGGKVFQDALVRTAAAMKGVTEETFRANNITGSFRESINAKDGTGWLTSDILVKTLTQFTMAAEEGSEEWKQFKKELMSEGYGEKEAEEILKMANTATDAATKVKTFTQLWDTLKESAQSGWTQTWEIIIGDFEEAKDFLTKISDTIGGMISESANARNELLSGAFSSGWKQLLNQGIADEEAFIDTVTKMAEGHGVAFEQMIKDAGSFEAALKKGLSEGSMNADILSDSVITLADKMGKMSAEELKAAGYTKENVKQIQDLAKAIKDGSFSMEEYADKITELSGREKLIKSLENAFDGVLNILKPIKEAFRELFPPLTSEQLSGFIDNIQALSERFKTLTSNVAPKVQSIFKGIFSVVDIVRKVIVSVMEALTDLSQSEGINSLGTFLLDTAVSIADFFTSLNEGFNPDGLTSALTETMSLISGILSGAVTAFEGIGSAIEVIGNGIVTIIEKIWEPLKEIFTWITENISAGDIFAGLAGSGVFMAMKDFSGFLDNIMDTINNIFKKDGGMSTWKDTFVECMNAVHDCLTSFTTGLKIWSIVGIGVALALLADAMEKISKIPMPNIAKSITAIGVLIAGLVLTLKNLTNILANFKPTGLISAAISMILIAEAINILADAMEQIGKLKLAEIAKGLIGIGGGLIALTKALKSIGNVNISLKTSVAMIALAQACKILGDAMQKFATLSWEEIARGLVGMGGALTEFTIVLSAMNKFTGGKSIFGSVALLIAVESLDELAAGLKKFGEMNWDEIGRGLTAMGGALGELTIALTVTGKIAGFSSIFASGAILGVTQGLDDLADALEKFGEISWEEVDRGLYAMGGALSELMIVLIGIGKIAGLSSVFASGAIWITIQGLDQLATSFEKFGDMTWDEIKRGLAGMGGALVEVGVVSGALGYLTGIAGVVGAGTITLAVQGLDQLATSFEKFGDMTWDEIKRGLAAMGGALVEVGVVSGALGYLTGIAGLVGAGTITLAVQGLDQLADCLERFGEMSWDEIKRGLSAMGGALGEVALGSVLNTLSALGALSISTVAEPIGALADSVKKWVDVTVPEGLADQLDELADGIEKFTFAGLGAGALNESAEAVGILADSVKKWSDVTVPDNLKKMFDTVADGIEKFALAGLGSSALNKSAEAVGILADSVKKWSDVTVPETLEKDMKAVSAGIRSFTFAFTGGWSMSSLPGPLTELATAVAAWANVTIPETVETDLTALANGVKAFSFAFVGGWSISSIITPLTQLPTAVAAWNGVTLPEGIQANLESLAAGVQAFAFAFTSGFSMAALVQPLADLPASIKMWSDVTFPEGLGENLKSLAAGIQPFKTVGDITYVANSVSSMAGSIKNLSGIDYPTVTAGITGVYDALKTFTSSEAIVTSIYTLSDTFTEAFKDAGSGAVEEVKDMLDNMIDAIEKKYSNFKTAGEDIADEIEEGIDDSESSFKNTVKTFISSAITVIEDKYSGFYDAGAYLVEGFAAGITENTFQAEAAAAAMAKAALEAAEEALDENSPSKEAFRVGDFFGVGFVNAIKRYNTISYSAGYEMADSARVGLNNAVNKISRIIDSEMEMQPTIRPVLDLSDIRSGTATISSMLTMGSSIGVLANVGSINTMMNRRNQNGSNADVVSAIKKLEKSIGNISGNNIQIGDITYDDGSNISDAVQEIVRAARVERRR